MIRGDSNPQNAWTCVSCRKRKIKCDKNNPCSNCTKAKIECVIPPSGRPSRKPRNHPGDELVERLARLEGVVNALKSLRQPGSEDPGVSPFLRECDEVELFRQWRKVSTANRFAHEENQVDGTSLQVAGRYGQLSSTSKDSPSAWPEHGFGRLLLGEGGSRYINGCFWASLDQEVKDLKGMLVDPLNHSGDEGFPSQTQDGSTGYSFLFGSSSSAVDILTPHPPRELIPRMWTLFKTNIDPLVKVFHTPSMEPKILAAKDHPSQLSKGTEAFMFVVYYSVVSSLTEDECIEEFGETQAVLSARYRFAFEQALARANFLDPAELITLEAFVIYLTILRRDSNERIVWSLTGLAVRTAQTIGLHRDGIHLGLAPFEVEMRRRLWWQLCLLDARASEDHGCAATIVETQFDTQMPLNVDDNELHPGMTELPESRKGFTGMTVCLVMFEFANIFRRILHRAVRSTSSFATLSIEQKEEWITQAHQRIEETYLAGMDLGIPPVWVAAILTRLLLSKIWLMVFHPLQRRESGVSFPHRIKRKLFLASIESIEYANLLDNDPRARQWGWLFRMHFQWHSTVFALSELCNNTEGELVERAWRAIGAMVRARFGDQQTEIRPILLWQLLKRLLIKARMAREKTLLAEWRLGSAGPGNLKPVACHPEIDALLRGSSTRRGTPGQFTCPTVEPPAIPGKPQIRSGANGTPGINGIEQELGGLFSTGFDWSTTSINTDPLTLGRPELESRMLVDDSEIHHTMPAGTDSQYELGDMNGTVDWEIWNDIFKEYEGENTGSSTRIEARYGDL